MDETDLTAAHSYRMNKIETIQNEIELERETHNALINKYNKRCAMINIIQNALVIGMMEFGATSLGVLSTVVGSPIAIVMDVCAITAGLLCVASSRLSKYFKTKREKHNKIKMLADSKLSLLEDDAISDEEYSLILSEYKEYNIMKEQVRLKTKRF